MIVELISNRRRKNAKIVPVISAVENVLWLIGIEFDTPAGDFWEIENPPKDWSAPSATS